MQGILILALLFALAVTLFAVQNATAVTVRFLHWNFQTYLAVVIFGSAALGAVVVALLGLVKQIRLRWRLRALQAQAEKWEEEYRQAERERKRLAEEVAGWRAGAEKAAPPPSPAVEQKEAPQAAGQGA
ncbi:MAG: LapA family protein [Bacillota bacterium]|nr:LapA family protein [Bacillota bacterium]